MIRSALVAVVIMSVTVVAEPPATQPVRVEALKRWPTLDAQQNALPRLLKIGAQLIEKRRTAPAPPATSSTTKVQAEIDAQRLLVTHMQEELRALDEVLQPDMQIDWGLAPLSPAVTDVRDSPVQDEIGFLLSGAVLCWDARLAREAGDFARMRKRLSQADRVARSIETHYRPSAVSIGRAIDRQILKVDSEFAANPIPGAIEPELRVFLEQRCRAYFKPDEVRTRAVDTLRLERLLADDVLEAMAAGRLRAREESKRLEASGAVVGRMLAQPFAGPKQMEWLSQLARDIESILEDPSVPFTRHAFGNALDARVVAPLRKDHMRRTALAPVAVPNVVELPQIKITEHARRRTIAVAIAVRLYQADHDQKLPPDLQALVPKYLPELPIDPSAAGADTMIQYRAGATPLVYCCDDDARDDGGTERDFVVALHR